MNSIFVYVCSICGLSIPRVFSEVGDADINAMENYIRDELPHVLKAIEVSEGIKLNIIEKSFIFGKKYASNEENFRLIPGERITIKNIAHHVKSKLAKNDNYFSSKSESKKFSPKNTVNTIIGLIYGEVESRKKSRKEFKTSSAECVVDSKQKLLNTLVDWFRQQNYHFTSDDDTVTTNDMTGLGDSDLENIRGSIKCILCSKSISVFCKRSQSSSSWTISNFTRHFQKCKKNFVEVDLDSSKSLVALTSGSIPTTNEEAVFAEYSKIFESQLVVQSIKMMNSTKRNDEHTEICAIGSEDKISVCKIEKDGNCLFSAISHQIESVKSGSEAHKLSTTKLRGDCVEYMKNNLQKYERDICYRIQEKFPDKQNLSLEECGKFIDDHLSKNGSWGGTETLEVLKDMLELNILIFNEKGCVYFAHQFESKFQRTIMIAFRISDPLKNDISNANRNHYDSVAKVERKLITSLANDLIKAYLKSSSLQASDSVILVD